MATLRQSVTGDDRTDPRYPIPRGLDAWVEVNLAGRCWCLPILEMSETGLSFEFVSGMGGMQVSSVLADLLVRVGDHEVRGAVTLLHATRSFAGATLCGGLFQPQTKADRDRFDQIVCDLRELVQPR